MNDSFWFGLIFIKKIYQIKFKKIKKTETGLNRLVLVWLGFFRFVLIFSVWLDFFPVGLSFFCLDSVRFVFLFQIYKTETKPVSFLKILIFFFTILFFQLFFWFLDLINFSIFFSSVHESLGPCSFIFF